MNSEPPPSPQSYALFCSLFLSCGSRKCRLYFYLLGLQNSLLAWSLIESPGFNGLCFWIPMGCVLGPEF